MSEKKNFDVKKTFGLSIILKLTKKNIDGVEVEDTGDRLGSNLSMEEMNRAVVTTMETHNIDLKID